MKQLTGMDLSFLLMDTDHTYGHVNAVSIYDRPSEDFDAFSAVRERMEIMVGNLAPLRRKVVEVPFSLDRPYWVEDEDFDLDYHVRHMGVAPPGAADQLAEQVARIVGRKMDRSRPLWEAYVIEGLADGRWALLQKTHHATIDGAAGVIMLKMLTDDARDAEYGLVDREWSGEKAPSDAEMLQTAVKNMALNPIRGTRLGLKIARDMADSVGMTDLGDVITQTRDTLTSLAGGTDGSPDARSKVSLPISQAPATPWNKSVSPHRRFAMRSTSLENLKQLKNATGGTLNDIVMAICTGAIRRYLIEHDALPDSALRAMVPVSIRTGKEADPWTNRVSALVADLPTNCEDPLERVTLCREAMIAGKQQFDMIPADAFGESADYTSPIVATAATRLASQLSDRVTSPVNVVISNVPGPREPLYFAGAKLDAYIPISTISDGIGLNITVHSYCDRMDFGLISDRDLVPDLWHLADLHIEEMLSLFDAAGLEPVVPQPPPPMRKGGDGVAPVATAKPGVTKRIKARRSVAASPSIGSSKAASEPKATKKPAAKKKPARKKTPAKKKPAAKKGSKK